MQPPSPDGADLHDQHAVVTGAGQGIGKAIAQTLAQAGARVTLMGRRLAVLQTAQQTLSQPERHQSIVCDVADENAVTTAFATAQQGFGGVEILVNNAGQALSSPFYKTSAALWQQMLGVNLSGVFFCTRAALTSMQAQKRGRIINIASTAAQKGYAYVSAYSAAKHGVLGLTRSLALELASQAMPNITVNAVCPGFTETALLQESVAAIVQNTGRNAGTVCDQIAKMNPQGRLIQPAEVAHAVLWLCLESSCGITGQAISVSGGAVMA